MDDSIFVIACSYLSYRTDRVGMVQVTSKPVISFCSPSFVSSAYWSLLPQSFVIINRICAGLLFSPTRTHDWNVSSDTSSMVELIIWQCAPNLGSVMTLVFQKQGLRRRQSIKVNATQTRAKTPFQHFQLRRLSPLYNQSNDTLALGRVNSLR